MHDFTPVPMNPTLVFRWDQRLVVDVALGTAEDTILETYDLQVHELRAIYRDSRFAAALAKLRKDLEADGASFKLKAKLQAEAMLDEHWAIVHDREISPETRRKAIADTVRWAGFDNSGVGGGGGGGGFAINIVLNQAPAEEPPFIIEGERPDV